ncbi:MAG: radical SAM protein [Myxococcota bacterium]
MRIALINPPVSKVLEAEYDRPDFPRPTLAALGGYMRQHQPETELLLIDAKLERMSFEQVVERTASASPSIIGITAFTNEIEDAGKLAAQLKAKLRGALIVIGGVHVTALPVLTLSQFRDFDVAVIGEGEETLAELCGAVARGESFDPIRGLYYRHGDELVFTGERSDRVMDLDELGMPAWDLLPPARRYYRVMAERGCPYACQFCMNPNGRKLRARSVDSMIEELESLVARGYDWFEFDDEIFGANQKFCTALLERMIETGLNERMNFYVLAHARFLNRDFCELLARAGCTLVGFGMETGEEDRLLKIGKGLTRERVVDATRDLQAVGITVRGFFIIGHENETWSSAMTTVDFAADLNLDIPVFGTMVPYPGTRVWELAIRGEGGYKKLSPSWNDYNKQVGGAVELETLSRRQMEIVQFLGYNLTFLRNRRFLDWFRFLWRYRTAGFTLLGNILRPKKPFRETEEITGVFFEDLLAVIPASRTVERKRAQA